MKINILKYISFILIISFIIPATSCKIGRFFIYNFADVRDFKKFPSRELKHDSLKFTFCTSSKGIIPKDILLSNNEKVNFDQYLEDNKTVAFLIIRNDSILYEKYFKGYDQTSIVPSFSMAKSVLSILIGCAIDDGFIKSVNEPITNYIPELKKNGLEKVTIKHLLQMTSGIKFNESYVNPFGDAATFYYGRNLRKIISRVKPESEPGLKFEYASGNPQILGLILERALKNKTVTQYFQEKLWSPLGMEYDASWSIDKKEERVGKNILLYQCKGKRILQRSERLYLNKGNWNGKQIVSQNWVKESTKLDNSDGSTWYYQYQWWIPTKTGDFMAQGILGQFIYVNPAKNLVIVRLGKKEGNVSWWVFFPTLASQL